MEIKMNYQKMGRVRTAGAVCVLLALALTVLADVGTFMTTAGAVAAGLSLGILGWVGYHRGFTKAGNPDAESIYPIVDTPTTLKAYTVVAVVSAFVLCFAETLLMKLAGAAGVAMCIGWIVASLIFNKD